MTIFCCLWKFVCKSSKEMGPKVLPLLVMSKNRVGLTMAEQCGRLRGGTVYKAVPISFAKQVSLSCTVVRVNTFKVSLISELKKKFAHYSEIMLYLTPNKYCQTPMAQLCWWSKLSFLWPGKV